MNDQLPTVVSQEPTHALAARTPLADLRDNALSVPVEQMRNALAEYADRRVEFYRWLLSQLEQGLHYGVPPGINQPGVEATRWRHKPSLYKAGADFICDLMGLRDEYEADLASWQMLGSPKDTFVRRCRLYSRSNDRLVGEGTGARRLGQNSKMLEANANIKMADKAAKVAAIINTYGLSDLFAQDLEDLDRRAEEYENPPERPDAPKVAPRGQRQQAPTTKTEISAEQFGILSGEWNNINGSEYPDKPSALKGFCTWALKQAPGDWNPKVLAEWNKARYDACMMAIGLGAE